MKPKPEKTRKLCEGCYDDFYNHNRPDGCWLFKSFQIVQLTQVGIWQNPPYTWNSEWRLSCYNPQGYVMIKKDDPRIKREEDG